MLSPTMPGLFSLLLVLPVASFFSSLFAVHGAKADGTKRSRCHFIVDACAHAGRCARLRHRVCPLRKTNRSTTFVPSFLLLVPARLQCIASAGSTATEGQRQQREKIQGEVNGVRGRVSITALSLCRSVSTVTASALLRYLLATPSSALFSVGKLHIASTSATSRLRLHLSLPSALSILYHLHSPQASCGSAC